MNDSDHRIDLRAQRLIETFVELADTLVADFDVVEFVTLLTERVVEFGLAQEAGLMLADATGRLQVLAASSGQTHMLELFELQHQQGPCYECYQSGDAIVIEDLTAELERWPEFSPRACELGFGAVMAIPLRLRRDRLGALNLFRAAGVIGPEELGIARAMADIATIGLLQERGMRASQDTAAQLQHALDARITVEQAKGVLAEQAGIAIDIALDRLRRHARDGNRRLTDVAQEVIAGTLTAADLAPAR